MMTKKALAVVALAGVIALSTGVITFVGTQNRDKGDALPAASEAADTVSESLTPDEDPATEDVTEAPTEAVTESEPVESGDGNDGYGIGDSLIAAGSFHAVRVLDHTTGDESTLREVFGKYYSECFLSFAGDWTFRMCLNPSAGEIRTGTYLIYDDVISVRYDSGTGSEFDVQLSDDGEIDCIIVNYGDYDVYFALW